MSAKDSPMEEPQSPSLSAQTDLSVSKAMLEREIRGIDLELDVARKAHVRDTQRIVDLERERASIAAELDHVTFPGVAPGEGWELWA